MGAEAQTLAMESMFEDDISILTQEALGPSVLAGRKSQTCDGRNLGRCLPWGLQPRLS